LKTDNNQVIKWILPKPIKQNELVKDSLNITLQKVLIRRGINLKHELNEYFTPSELPNPEEHFNELEKATLRIIQSCARNEKIAICGDFDADGITSTALLVEIFSSLGARVESFIPSREDQGYGLNYQMINEINSKNIKLIITVDNGISAFDAIKRSNDLGIDLIITDHHKIPKKQLIYHSLIHPERTPINSPYKYLAGVGIAYILAKNICNRLNYDINKSSANELYCIGTIADMAPIKGANRKHLKENLPKLNTTTNKGLKSIIKKLFLDKKEITTEDVGYKIAPFINSVGRIGDPKLMVDLLTNESLHTVDKLTKECFVFSKKRKKITALIHQEALEMALDEYKFDSKFLVLTKKDWHPGIIGIVAARIVDKFNLPTAVLAKANDGNFRGSVRSNKYLNVSDALDECRDLLLAHGGHSAAAGFSIKESNIKTLSAKLNSIANREFADLDISKSINPDAYINFRDINYEFYDQLNSIGPFGIMNPTPIFWTRKCRVENTYKMKGGHLRATLNDGTSVIEALKWNYTKNLKINDLIDIAFNIEINNWRNSKTLQLNLLDIKKHENIVDLKIHKNSYKCQLTEKNEILVTNSRGESINSDLYAHSENYNTTQELFVKKILTFAEIALGKAA
tara:strand:- start:627 stop:2516 length:1890 start_codon:yes stop_codon:yes gene_type:complete